MAKLSLPLPIEKEFPLNLPVDEDPDQSAYVKFRMATIEEESRVSDLTRKVSREYTADGSQVVTLGYSNLELRRLQVYLTMTDCSILDFDEKPLFKFSKQDGVMRSAMSVSEFNSAYGKLPSKWADKIVIAMFDANPNWDPRTKDF